MTEKELLETLAKLKELCADLIDHLDYCGWGDTWERECSKELQARARKFQETGAL